VSELHATVLFFVVRAFIIYHAPSSYTKRTSGGAASNVYPRDPVRSTSGFWCMPNYRVARLEPFADFSS
jgi:hypothetical protein